MKLIALLLWFAPVQDDFLSGENVRKAADEVRPLVEKASASAFGKKPSIRLSSKAEVRAILLRELTPQMKVLLPEASGAERRAAAESIADTMVEAMLGKYAHADNTIHVVASNFKALAALYRNPAINSAEYLRVVLIHEMVHALDEDRFGVFASVPKAGSQEELLVLNALAEGHAQYVTRKVLAAEKKEDLFWAFEGIVTELPPGLDEATKTMVRPVLANVILAYVDGRKFFEGLESEKKEGFVKEAFTKRPKDTGVILNPERYYHPERTPKPKDVSAIWDEMEKDLGDEWTSRKTKLNRAMLQGAFADNVDKEKVDAVLKKMVGGEVLSSARNGGMNAVIAAVTEMRDAAAASEYYDMNVTLLKAKDEKMKEGAIRITKAEYGKLKTTKPARHLFADKEVNVQGTEVRVQVVLALVDRFVVEINYSNVDDMEKKDYLRRLNRMTDLLRK